MVEGVKISTKTDHISERKHKRKKSSQVLSSSDEEATPIVDMWPNYLLIQETDPSRPLSGVSAFALNKAIQGMAGTPKEIKRLRYGDLLVCVTKKSHSANLLATNQLVDVPVRVLPHKTLNSVRGVIRDREFIKSSENEILEELASQGVTEVRQIKVRREGVLCTTATVILSFGLHTLPSHVTCGWLRLQVDPYIPNPLRCFRCQRFGHHKNSCRRDEVCARCGTQGHNDTDCEALARCVNCKGDHSSYSKNCPKWKEESQIQRVKVLENLSFPDARKKVEQSTSRPTYAAVAQKQNKTVSVCCQTKLTWVTGADPQTFRPVVPPPVAPRGPAPAKTTSVGCQTPTDTDISQRIQQIRNSAESHSRPAPAAQPKIKIKINPPPKPDSSKKKEKKKKPVLPPKPTTSPSQPSVSASEPERQAKGASCPIALYNRFGLIEVDVDPDGGMDIGIDEVSDSDSDTSLN